MQTWSELAGRRAGEEHVVAQRMNDKGILIKSFDGYVPGPPSLLETFGGIVQHDLIPLRDIHLIM